MPGPAGNATSQPCRRRAFPKAIKALPCHGRFGLWILTVFKWQQYSH